MEDIISPVLTLLLNILLALGEVPDSLKLGVLTPVFKKKGSNLNAKTIEELQLLLYCRQFLSQC